MTSKSDVMYLHVLNVDAMEPRDIPIPHTKPYKTKQIAARAAETSTKYTKPKKTAKLAATSPKLYKSKQNAARPGRDQLKIHKITQDG